MIESFVETYGYFALFIGTILEGETILVVAGFLAHRGYFHLQWIIVAALLGSFIGDQIFFQIGKKSGIAFIKKRPHWQNKIRKVQDLLDRYQNLIILGFRFMYGFRTVTPFVIGMSGYKTSKFMVLNFIGSVIWATVIGSAGYFFGNLLETLLGEVKKYELAVIIILFSIGFLLWGVHFLHRRRAAV